MKRLVGNPFAASIAVLVLLTALGFAAIGLGWRGLAASLFVPVQLPYAISGVIGGLALVGFAVGVMTIQIGRRREAAERADLARVTSAAADLLAAARRSR